MLDTATNNNSKTASVQMKVTKKKPSGLKRKLESPAEAPKNKKIKLNTKNANKRNKGWAVSSNL